MRKFLTYGAGLIALYLIVANATGFGTALSASGNVLTGGVKAFQGR